MAPAYQQAAEWVDVRPLRRTLRAPPGEPPQRTPAHGNPQPGSLFLAPDHRPPLAGIKLVRPRPRPEGALTLRALIALA